MVVPYLIKIENPLLVGEGDRFTCGDETSEWVGRDLNPRPMP